MPALSVWAVRLSLVYLVVGVSIGGLLLAAKAVPLPPALWLLQQAHVEALLFGFMVQLAFGVAFWILPLTPVRTAAWPAAVALLLLNAGVWLAAAAPLVQVSAVQLAGRAVQLAAVATFALYIWPRVRGFGIA